MHDLARLVREGETPWEDLNLDDVEVRLKWAGLFHRKKRTPGKFMMRLKIPNGELTAEQMDAVAALLEPYGADACLDITTRANLQLRGIPFEDIDKAVDQMDAAGLQSRMSGMDNVRNITGNPLAGVDPHELLDTRPLAYEINDMITDGGRGNPALANLPRKLNISISATPDDFVHNHINDLGFEAVVHPRTQEVGFNVVVGGYFSVMRNITSIPLNCFVRQDQMVAFCKAFLEVFRDHGARGNRQKTRVMWLVEDWGIEKFRAAVEAQGGFELEDAVPENHPAGWERRVLFGVGAQKQEGMSYVGCCVPAGRMLPADMRMAAEVARRYGDGTCRMTCEQNLVFPHIPNARVEECLADPFFARFSTAPGMLTGGLVSCTGSQFCGLALIETKQRAMAICEKLEEQVDLPKQVRIHWTGCPNSCGQAQVGDIGLMGAPAKLDGKAVEGVKILLGGKIGQNPELAKDFEKGIPCEEEYLIPKLKEILINEFGATEKGAGKQAGASRRTPVAAALAATPGTAATPPPPPPPSPECSLPPSTYQKAVALGAAKAAAPLWKTFMMSVLAGAFIGFGGTLAFTVGAAVPGIAAANPGLQKMILGAFGLPFGLLMVLLSGADLFTGNTMLVTMAKFEGKASTRDLLKNWGVSYLGNFIGSLLVVALVATSGLLAGAAAAGPTKVAAAKASLAFVPAVARGIICNWLVCMAIWQATAATSLPGKALGVWFPISSFVAMGAEHSIANMFMIPLGIALGSTASASGFLFSNLLPVTLGNIIGGAVCCACVFSLNYGALGARVKAE